MIVRLATVADARWIADVHVASWQVAYRGLIPDDALDAMTPSQREPMWQRILTDPALAIDVLVADRDGEVIGFTSLGPDDERPEDGDYLMMHTLYLNPVSMRRGVGTALLAAAEARMRERGACTGSLRVMTDNAAAIGFYQARGWQEASNSARIEDAWGQQRQTVRYEKSLTRAEIR